MREGAGVKKKNEGLREKKNRRREHNLKGTTSFDKFLGDHGRRHRETERKKRGTWCVKKS